MCYIKCDKTLASLSLVSAMQVLSQTHFIPSISLTLIHTKAITFFPFIAHLRCHTDFLVKQMNNWYAHFKSGQPRWWSIPVWNRHAILINHSTMYWGSVYTQSQWTNHTWLVKWCTIFAHLEIRNLNSCGYSHRHMKWWWTGRIISSYIEGESMKMWLYYITFVCNGRKSRVCCNPHKYINFFEDNR